MKSETRRYINQVLYERAVYASEKQWSSRDMQWRMYKDFKKHVQKYTVLVWLVKKLPVITFGIGLILGLMTARLI